MRAFDVIVFHELAHEIVEMRRATRNEVVEALLLQRLVEPVGALALARLSTSGSIFSPVRTNALSG